MKKQSIILFISILISFSSVAQRKLKQLDEEEAKKNEQYQPRNNNSIFNPEKWSFGGNIGGGFFNGGGFLFAQPLAGYHVKENTVTGVGLTYIYQGNKYYSMSAYGPVLFVRQTILNQFFAHIQYQPINHPYIYNGYLDLNRPRVWENILYVGGGYGARRGGYFSVLYNLLWNQNTSLNASPYQINIGFMF